MASASMLDASSSSGGFASERVFPIRMDLVTESGRGREALPNLGKALHLPVPTELTSPKIQHQTFREVARPETRCLRQIQVAHLLLPVPRARPKQISSREICPRHALLILCQKGSRWLPQQLQRRSQFRAIKDLLPFTGARTSQSIFPVQYNDLVPWWL